MSRQIELRRLYRRTLMVRLSDKQMSRLEAFCIIEKCTKAEAIRYYIDSLNLSEAHKRRYNIE